MTPQNGRHAAYPEYRRSGVTAIAEIPEHWDVARLASIGRFFRGKGGSKEDELSSGVPCVRYGDLYTCHDFFITETRSFVSEERASDYFPVAYGDLLFAASGETYEDIGKSSVCLISERVCCGGDIQVLRPTRRFHPRFLGYAADCLASRQQKSRLGHGFTVVHLYANQLRNLRVAIPTLPEQGAIAAFLDRETAKIDALVAEKEQLIELLEEKRTALIAHAVTKGLDPDVPMKDSGVEWLGEIPTHWSTIQLRRLFRKEKRQGYPNLTVLSVYRDYGVIEKDSRSDNFNKTPEDLGTYQLVEVGDLVINKMKAWQGSLGISPFSGITSPDYIVYSARHNHNPRFLHYALRNRSLASVFRTMSNGIRPSQWRLEPERFESMPVLIPPHHEQRELVKEIDDWETQATMLVARIREAISNLHEYRTTLISAAVTGKIDVRGEVA